METGREVRDPTLNTFWNDVAPKEYDFWSNVDPTVPHPRWSQATERVIDTNMRIPTLPLMATASMWLICILHNTVSAYRLDVPKRSLLLKPALQSDS